MKTINGDDDDNEGGEENNDGENESINQKKIKSESFFDFLSRVE